MYKACEQQWSPRFALFHDGDPKIRRSREQKKRKRSCGKVAKKAMPSLPGCCGKSLIFQRCGKHTPFTFSFCLVPLHTLILSCICLKTSYVFHTLSALFFLFDFLFLFLSFYAPFLHNIPIVPYDSFLVTV